MLAPAHPGGAAAAACSGAAAPAAPPPPPPPASPPPSPAPSPPPSPPPSPLRAAGAPPPAAADAALRIARPPLKRRSTGQLPGVSRGLSRNYAGKSQSFTCIQDLARNPWGADTAVSLAKRSRPAPLDDCGAASPFACASLPLPPPAFKLAATSLPSPLMPRLSPGGALLSWSIGEEEECLLGGVTCSARLHGAGSCSSTDADGSAAADSSCGASSRSSSGGLGAAADAPPPLTLPAGALPLGWPAASSWAPASVLCGSGLCGSASSDGADDDAASDDVCMGTEADALTAALRGARLAAPLPLPPRAAAWLSAAALMESG
jgi:hypothetical protein